jgi:hypothetical protein
MAYPQFDAKDARVLILEDEYLYNPDTGYVFDMDTKGFVGTFTEENAEDGLDDDIGDESEVEAVEYMFVRYDPSACEPLFDTPEFWKKHHMITESKIAEYRKVLINNLKLRHRAGLVGEWKGMIFEFVYDDEFSDEHYET